MININDFEKKAATMLPTEVFDFLAGGAADETTLQTNLDAFKKIFLRPRVLVDVSQIDLNCKVLGHQLRLPIIAAPVAFKMLAHREGELALARAVANARIGHTLSLNATKSIEDVARAAPTLPEQINWFQLYVLEDRAATQEIVERAVAAGHNGICITVDRPVRGKRDRDIKNNFSIPKNLKPGNLSGGFAGGNTPQGGAFSAAHGIQVIDPSLSWKDLEWLKQISKVPVILKGILHPLDAVMAVDHGIDGIVVSNHGGRNLDGVISPIEALPDIVNSVQNRSEIFVDGGIRRGTDILKALALGAKAVLLGRPLVWGLACDGQQGVTRVIQIFEEELRIAMALTGCVQLKDITSQILYRSSP